jgi:hypothetical protein
MSEAIRDPSWRQGNILTNECAVQLGLIKREELGSKFWIVISHDCDLASVAAKEPNVELIIGELISKLSSDSHAKNARRLDLKFADNSEPKFLKLLAVTKRSFPKEVLFKNAPSASFSLDASNLVTLQRWLAARYYRAAFPESFEIRLREASLSGKISFLSQIELILDEGGEYIRSLLFNLDEGKMIERTSTDDCYSLGITVLYDSSKDENKAFEVAEKAAQNLDDLFNKAFNSTANNKWNGVELIYCDAISDNSLSVAQRELLKQWRIEHMSLREEPHQTMLVHT